MKEHPFYFKGIGKYDPDTGETFYNVIIPKIEGLTFKFDTDNIRKITYWDEDYLMICTSNGKDDDSYSTTPEVIQIQFTIDHIQEYNDKPIKIIINHDADQDGRATPGVSRKPGVIGIGVVRP